MAIEITESSNSQKAGIRTALGAASWLREQALAGSSPSLLSVMSSPPTIDSDTSALSGATQIINCVSGNNNFLIPDAFAQWTFAGLFIRGYNTAYVSGTGNQNNTENVSFSEQWTQGVALDFWLDGTEVSIQGLTGNPMLIEVDGQLASLTATDFGTSNGWLRIAFASKAVRRIKIRKGTGKAG